MIFDFKKKKPYDYFEEFVNISKISVEAAEFLDAKLKNYEEIDMAEARAKMHEFEHKADDVKHAMLKKLIGEFLPPIDRDDIISLSHDIDEVTDAIEEVFICFDMFKMTNVYSEVFEFTELIVECCKHMNLALIEFKNFKKSDSLFEELEVVNDLKSRGEAMHIRSIRNLYQISEDTVNIMAYTEIYRRLNMCCKKCKIVTNNVERIVLKNL